MITFQWPWTTKQWVFTSSQASISKLAIFFGVVKLLRKSLSHTLYYKDYTNKYYESTWSNVVALNNNYKKMIFEKQLHCCNSIFHLKVRQAPYDCTRAQDHVFCKADSWAWEMWLITGIAFWTSTKCYFLLYYKT